MTPRTSLLGERLAAAGFDDGVLVLEMLAPRPAEEGFWAELADVMARLHATTHARFGWHRDNWLGRRRQVNTWADDGFRFFAEHRLLRWLDEPTVLAQFEDLWGTGDVVRETLAPFRRR